MWKEGTTRRKMNTQQKVSIINAGMPDDEILDDVEVMQADVHPFVVTPAAAVEIYGGATADDEGAAPNEIIIKDIIYCCVRRLD